MRNAIEEAIGSYKLYKPRREEYQTDELVPFRVAPEPFCLSETQRQYLKYFGHDITAYFTYTQELYQNDEVVHTLLDRGKPELFLQHHNPQHLFIRPDLIITPGGFTLCEIETSIFGLALADILNQVYRDEGCPTLVEDSTLKEYIQIQTLPQGELIYSAKTAAYEGQLAYLAETIFGRDWNSISSDQIETVTSAVYRAFYLHEYMTDPTIQNILNQVEPCQAFPSLTPQFEEKALLALLWDKRWEEQIEKQLGKAAFCHLRSSVPPTWILGEEEYFSPGLPDGVTSSIGLSGLSPAKRQFVLKSSGFSSNSSWAEGVQFLHRYSQENARLALLAAQQDATQLHIVQEFRKPIDNPMIYEEDGLEEKMNGRIRLTPYYAQAGQKQGDLVALKATAVENTDRIHATTSSINTAVR